MLRPLCYTNVAQAISEAKAGKVEYRLDKTNIIHCPIGNMNTGDGSLCSDKAPK